MTSPASSPLRLHGVDHTARPTWRLRETVHFYRDVLKLSIRYTRTWLFIYE